MREKIKNKRIPTILGVLVLVIGIAAVLHTSPLQAFSTVTDELRKHPRVFILAAKQFRDILNSYNSPIYAEASSKEKNATGYLEYVGFEHYNGRVYSCCL